MRSSTVNIVVAALPGSPGRLVVPGAGGPQELPFPALAPRVTRVRHRLAALGLARGDVVGICAANSVEWVVLDLACIALGIVTAPLDINADHDPHTLFERFGLARLFSDREALLGHARSHAMAELASWGATGDHVPADGPVDAPAVHYRAHDELTWKFTSGSTGEPKVLAARVESIDESIALVQDMFGHGPGDSLFVFLPLSLLQQRYWVYSAIVHGHDVVLTRYEHALPALRATRPTVVMGVPGFFDALKAYYTQWAATQEAPSLAGFLGGRVRYLWTGSAPAQPDTLAFFRAAGVPIYEGYGLNETCIIAKNHPAAHRPGSVGRIVRNKSVSFDASGQILAHSRYPINARYAFCAQGESEATFVAEGVVATGDIGHLDEDGYLYITGRVKDLIALSSGKKVHPRLVEARIGASPLVENVLVHGTGRPTLVAVVVPRPAAAAPADVEREVLRLNSAAPPEEKIRRVVIASEPFTRENGLLTSQYKLKRDAIVRRYQQQIDACYAQ